jgi:glycosyltransferase involved in cell wall biosynthesis
MHTLRLAVYGPISAHSGSMATALFRLAEALLRAGHEIDLYSPSTWIDPAYLLGRPRFRYIPVDLAQRKRVRELTPSFLPRLPRLAVDFALTSAQRALHEREVVGAIRREHAASPYDALVVLNTLSTLDLQGELPVVSFPQGAPGGESEFIRREPRLVRDECGWAGWAILRSGYSIHDPTMTRAIKRSHFIVVPSQWTGEGFRRVGVAPERIARIFPPVDLAHFRMAPRPADARAFRFLWLGRVVPRKRFPLALAALALLRRRRPGANLQVIGGGGYGPIVPRYRLPALEAGVERLEAVAHAQVPALLGSVDAILQPSENENFGGSAAEGLACGVPTVLGPTNGTIDALKDSAFRFDRYEPESVAEAMERAMDAVLADPLGTAQRARAIAEETLDVDKIAQQAADLVRGVAARWQRP